MARTVLKTIFAKLKLLDLNQKILQSYVTNITTLQLRILRLLTTTLPYI